MSKRNSACGIHFYKYYKIEQNLDISSTVESAQPELSFHSVMRQNTQKPRQPRQPAVPGAALVAEALVVLQCCQNCRLKLNYYHKFGVTL